MANAAPNPDNMLETALSYLDDFAWSVIPVCVPIVGHAGRCAQHGECRNPGKMPLVKWGVYQDRQPTRLEIEGWWRRWTDANIGLVTGRTSDVVAIDLDGEVAQAEAQRYGYDPGPWVNTGRIGGRHLYFRFREDAPTIFAKTGGIDFRGHGGFVLLPPSLHRSGAHYAWGEPYQRGEPLPDLPHWIDSLASTNELGIERGPIDFGHLLTEGIREGQRDQELFRAAAKLRGADVPYDFAVELIEHAALACRPPFDVVEARAKVDSAYSRYSPNGANGVSPRLNGTVTVDTATGEVLDEDPWMGMGDLIRMEDDAELQIVAGLLWDKHKHWLYSSVGAGKTMLSLAIGMHVAMGVPFCGRDVVQGGVYLLEEDQSKGLIRKYVRMLNEVYEFDVDELHRNFRMNRLRGNRLADAEGLAKVKAMLIRAIQSGVPPRLLILDACERLVPSEKWSTKELAQLGELLDWCVDNGMTTVVIDHTRKQVNGGKSDEKPDPISMLYGGMNKGAIADVMMYLTGSIKTTATLSFPKIRDEEQSDIHIKFSSVEGFNLKQGKKRLDDTEQLIQSVLNEASRTHKHLTSAEVATTTELSQRTAQRVLSDLVKAGYAEEFGAGRTTTYGVGAPSTGMFS